MKLDLISAGVAFNKQRKPWLLEVYLEDASGRTLLDCTLIPPGEEFYNFKLTQRTSHTLRSQNLDQVFIVFSGKYIRKEDLVSLLAYANVELSEYDSGIQEPKITRKILGKKRKA